MYTTGLPCLDVQRIECVGSWIRESHIRPSNFNGMGLPMVPAIECDMEGPDDKVLDEIKWI